MVGVAAADAVWIDVLPSLKGFGPALAQGAGAEADKQGKSIGSRYGKAMLAGVAVVAGGASLATRALYNIGATFDDMSDTIRVGTGATGKALDDLVASAKSVGQQVPAEFADVGTAIADINTRLGLTGPELETVSKQFLELSRITGTDVARNIEVGSQALMDWQISTEDQSDALDYLFKVSQATGAGFDELAGKTQQFGAPMRQLGFSFEETAAMIGQFEREGVNTDKAMAGLSASLGRMAESGKDPQREFARLADEIKSAGSTAEANAVAVELFGTRAGPQMAQAIREGRMEVDDLMATLDESGETILGAGQDTWDFSEQWRMFKNDIMVGVAPAAEWLFSKISEGMEWVRTKGVPWVKDLWSSFSSGEGTLGGIGDTVSTVFRGIRDGVGGAISRVVSAVRDLISEWRDGEGAGGRIRDIFEQVRDAAKSVASWVGENVVDAVKDLVRGFQDGEGVGGKFRDFLDAVVGLAKDVYGWIADNVVPAIKGFFDEMRTGEGAGGAFQRGLEGARDALETVVGWALDFGRWLADNKAILAGFTGALVAYKVALIGITVAKKGAAIATGLWTAAQKLLNLALKANPIGIVIAVIAGLVAAVITAYNTNEDFRKLVDRVWSSIKSAISGTVDWFRNTAWPWMRDALQWVGDKATWLYEKAIQPAWDGIWGAISWAWDQAEKVFDKFKDGVSAVGDAFSTAKTAISSIWASIVETVGGPINVVLQFVNDSLIAGLNWLFDKIPGVSLQIPDIPMIPIPKVPRQRVGDGGGSGRAVIALADGGTVPGQFIHATADNVLAHLTPKEFVTRVSSAERMRRNHPGALEYINRYGTLPGYADGGRVGDKRQGGLFEVMDRLADAGRFVRDLFVDPVGLITRTVTGFLGGIGDSMPAQVIVGAAGEMARGFGDWVKGLFTRSSAGGGPDGQGLPWQTIWAMIKNAAPEAVMTSNYRPGAITAAGNPSMHGLGRAVDIVPASMSTFMKIRNLLPWHQLIFTPAGPLQKFKNQSHMFDPITASMHFDHIHAAYAQGGTVQKPLLFDQGGYLPTGLSLVRNDTGKPEPLRRVDMERGGERHFHMHSLDENQFRRMYRNVERDDMALMAAGAGVA